MELVVKAIINGYGNSAFKPESSVTRAELAVIIVKALGLEVSNGNTGFKDDNRESSMDIKIIPSNQTRM